MRRLTRSLGLGLVLWLLAATGAGAATLEPIGTFNQPIFITSDPGDSSRILVVERQGLVAEVDGEAAPHLYADLTDFVACCAGERGLLSIAPDPKFHQTGVFYAAYAGKPAAGGNEGDIHVDAFTADAAGEVTRTPVITIPHTPEANHNGGQIQFGPDGNLYISTGDGGGGGDPFENGQNLNSLLGKILRIDPDPGGHPAYTTPSGNPFAGPGDTGADEIWAYGLRNPWRFSFDSLTGDMLIGDVGQGQREEVDLAASPAAGVVGGAGVNYGWSCREGTIAYTDATPSANCAGVSNFTGPIFDYDHTGPGGGAQDPCSITGGYLVRDPSLGDLYGRYVYGDYCDGVIHSLKPPVGVMPAEDRLEGLSLPLFSLTSFGEDSCHRVYLASASTVYRFVGAAPADCTVPPEGEGEQTVPPLLEVPVTETPNPFTPSPPPPASRPIVSLEADDFGRGSFRLRVQANGCAPSDTDSIQLNRGGRRFAAKPGNKGCAARFHVHVEGRASFRAIYKLEPGATPIRSRSIRVG